jgi:parallel beta-helix repeat protein
MNKRRSMGFLEHARLAIVSLVLLVSLLHIGVEANAATASVECGSVVTQDVTLKSDVGPCAGDGLVVAASGIEINLNGYKIFAHKHTHVGVRLDNVANVIVKGGTIEGFDTGVLIAGGLGNTVTKITAQNNRFGIQIENAESSGHRVEKTIASENRLIGILLRQFVSGATVIKNSVSENVGYGIVLDGGSSLNVVEDNRALSNGDLGIVLRGEGRIFLRTVLAPPVFSLVSPTEHSYISGIDYHVAAGRGDTTARLVPIDIYLDPAASSFENPSPADTSTSGCQLSDYSAAGFQPGDIALIQRGTCTLDRKIITADAAGARGVIIFNEGQASSRTTHDFGAVGEPLCCGPVPFPVLSASYATGFQLYQLAKSNPVLVRLSAATSLSTVTGTPPTHNNLLTKNEATSALDENLNCGSNQWVKNVFGSGSPCPSGGPSGLGATSHNY